MSVKISSKYQIVIPESVREAFGVKPGMGVDVIAKGGIACIVPVRSLSAIGESVKKHISDGEPKSAREKKDRKV